VNAIAAHHQEVEYACLEAPIVQVADAISASRPGARGESVELYLSASRLQAIAGSFAGVDRSFAVQAGGKSGSSSGPRRSTTCRRPGSPATSSEDRGVADLPGQIKVTVIRETRSVEYAK